MLNASNKKMPHRHIFYFASADTVLSESGYMSVSFYLIASTLVDRHMPLQLSSVCEAVAALRAAEALFGLLVPILDVLL